MTTTSKVRETAIEREQHRRTNPANILEEEETGHEMQTERKRTNYSDDKRNLKIRDQFSKRRLETVN